jgi:hypothetical protein
MRLEDTSSLPRFPPAIYSKFIIGTYEFMKTHLQGRQETRFLVVLLSGRGDSTTTIRLPEERQHESNAGEEPDDSSDANHSSMIIGSTDAPIHEE